jgi:ferric-dicitrate binding protein FerR (iron transport regulator)
MRSAEPGDREMKERVRLFVTGELDESEHKRVFDWIVAASRNRRYYDGLRASLKAAEFFRSEGKFDRERVRSQLDKRMDMAGPGRKTDFRILFRVAAALLLLLASYLVFDTIREYRQIRVETVVYNTVESPFGSRARVFLPDSTHVMLNAGSTLKYPVDFPDRARREVLLNGEGYFEVRNDKRTEFVVRVGDIEITALGTVFNVKAYPGESLIEATLVEGLLRINRGSSPRGAVLLHPNEKISIVKEESKVRRETDALRRMKETETVLPERISIREVHVERNINPVVEVSWKDREWVIRGETMEELSVMLSRRYNAEFVLGDDNVGDFRFSGTLLDETLEQVLYAIRSTAPIDYRIEGNKVVLTENTTLKKKYEKLLKGYN